MQLATGSVCVLLCYSDPVFEEQEQELPLIRWWRYFRQVERERFLENMTLITISERNPVVQHGSVHSAKCDMGKDLLWFRDKSDNITMFTPYEVLNQAIEKQFQQQGLLKVIPRWNGKEVVLGPLSLFDNAEYLTGSDFVKEWVGILCVSLFQVTKVYLNRIKAEKVEIDKIELLEALKCEKPSEKLFWIWWPPIKPRSLDAYLQKMGAEDAVDLKFLNQNPPIISGAYRVSFAQATNDGEQSWLMNVHADSGAQIPVFFETDKGTDAEKSTNDGQIAYMANSEEVRVVFNHNFALKHGFQEGMNVYGIFGSLTYVTAQLLPYRKDNQCPIFPCLSQQNTLHAYKEAVSKEEKVPHVTNGILARASRLLECLRVVVTDAEVNNVDC